MTASARGRPGRMQVGRVPQPLALVIFGGTGDLARRKLIPALFRLFVDGLLPERFALIGAAFEPLTDAEYRERLRADFPDAAPDEWGTFAASISYVGGDFSDGRVFELLRERLPARDDPGGVGANRLYYLAVPPAMIGTIVGNLAAAGLVYEPFAEAWSRVVVEKPFGHDLQSARSLNVELSKLLAESQIYRIDHYLGKETVQNLLVFRFANVIWEPIWSRVYVDHVQITVAEEVGIGTRAGYYERAGAIRDMVQSHLLQLLCLIGMEPPSAYDADSIRNEKVKVLEAVRPVGRDSLGDEMVRGQYTAGSAGAGKLPGYRDEPGVAPESTVETFVALRLWLDNWRWAGVPFLLRTGKRLAAQATEILIQFRPAPHPILDTVEGDTPAPNLLVLCIQPCEEISVRFEAKVPGLGGPLRPVTMDFSYEEAFGSRSPAAYERLLLDAMLGDPTLFSRRDEVEAAWEIVAPLLEAISTPGAEAPAEYPAGSWGPTEADALLPADSSWRVPKARPPAGP